MIQNVCALTRVTVVTRITVLNLYVYILIARRLTSLRQSYSVYGRFISLFDLLFEFMFWSRLVEPIMLQFIKFIVTFLFFCQALGKWRILTKTGMNNTNQYNPAMRIGQGWENPTQLSHNGMVWKNLIAYFHVNHQNTSKAG